MRRLAVALLVLVVLTAVGIVAASCLLSDVEVRRFLKAPPDTPDPVAWAFGYETPTGPAIVPLDKMGVQRGPNPFFRRTSWEGAEQGRRPADPRADPKRGTTSTMYFHTALETRISTLLLREELPNKVLRVGIWSPPAPRGRAAARTPRGAEPVHDCICYVEVWSGSPISRPALEMTIDRVVRLTLDAAPAVAEVDVVAVPWRSVPGHKPPIWMSVTARREAYFGVEGARSAMENLRTCGDVWVDPRVMSGFPIPR